MYIYIIRLSSASHPHPPGVEVTKVSTPPSHLRFHPHPPVLSAEIPGKHVPFD
jgi:hypothetical protein